MVIERKKIVRIVFVVVYFKFEVNWIFFFRCVYVIFLKFLEVKLFFSLL